MTALRQNESILTRRLWLLILTACWFAGNLSAHTSLPADSMGTVKKSYPQFFAFNTMGGIVLPTNDYIKAGNSLPAYSSVSFKYGIGSRGDTWQDVAYGMPYYGVGVYAAKFYNKNALGTPISVYLFQGGNLAEYNSKWSLKYELQLGMSFNWKPFDAFDNPDNIALGSAVNAHIGANLYLKRQLSPVWDLNFGLGLTHFSNGANQLPNKGLNLVAPFVELAYNFNRDARRDPGKETFTPPPLEDRIDYDIIFTSSSRQIRVDTAGTGLPSRLLDKNFKVLGLSYATMFVRSYKYKWGPSLELVYDESSGVKVWRQQHPVDGMYYDRIKLGEFHERFSLGLSIKGEMTFPYVSFFANLGYNILHGNDYDYRLYQILGAKAYIKDNLFATFGIRAARLSKAQYLFWSIGYTINGNPLKKKDKYIHHLLP